YGRLSDAISWDDRPKKSELGCACSRFQQLLRRPASGVETGSAAGDRGDPLCRDSWNTPKARHDTTADEGPGGHRLPCAPGYTRRSVCTLDSRPARGFLVGTETRARRHRLLLRNGLRKPNRQFTAEGSL